LFEFAQVLDTKRREAQRAAKEAERQQRMKLVHYFDDVSHFNRTTTWQQALRYFQQYAPKPLGLLLPFCLFLFC
jgi:hypothetical protein